METPNTDVSTGQQQPSEAKRPSDTPDHGAPAATDPAKGSPAKGAHQFGDDGAKAES